MQTLTFRFSAGGKVRTGRADYHEVIPKRPPSAAGLPIVILVHGKGGEKRDWSSPGYMGWNYDYEGSGPADRDHGWHALPPVGLPNIPPQLDRLRNVTGIEPDLRLRGFRTVNYTQADTNAAIADGALELEALINSLLNHPKGPKGKETIALVAHSRGGLVVRKFLKDNVGTPVVQRISHVVTLATPNQGSQVANLAAAAGVSISALVAGLSPVPGLGTIIRQAFTPYERRLSGSAIVDLAVGSQFLTRLAANEQPLPGVRYLTFGGTSVTLTRIWQYIYKASSFTPQRLDLRSFRHRSEAAQWPIISPLAETLPAPCDELRHRRGDGLVSNERAKLPFCPHRTMHLNHAEFLWDSQVKRELASFLS